MPNWCQGTIKVRGKKSNVLKWLDKGISGTTWFDYEEPKILRITDNYDEIEVEFGREAYCEGTRRHFISGCGYWYYGDSEDEDPIVMLCLDIRAAWGFNKDSWADISKKYNLEFRLHGFERGCEFEQIVEANNGDIVEDKVVEYEDYNWKAYDSRLGG